MIQIEELTFLVKLIDLRSWILRRKILLFSFYLLYSHENEFSLIERAEMTQNEKVTRSVSQVILISSIRNYDRKLM